MVVYCVVMFAVSVLFSAFSILIYKGKTDLIHDNHQTKVTNKTAYGRAFGKAMAVIAGTIIPSSSNPAISITRSRSLPVHNNVGAIKALMPTTASKLSQ